MKYKYHYEKKKKSKNHLEERFANDINDIVSNANYFKDNPSDFRATIERTVLHYKDQTTVNRASCKMQVYWPTDANGKFSNSGSIKRDADDTHIIALTITEETA